MSHDLIEQLAAAQMREALLREALAGAVGLTPEAQARLEAARNLPQSRKALDDVVVPMLLQNRDLTHALAECHQRLHLLVESDRHKLLDVVARDKARDLLVSLGFYPKAEVSGG